MHTCHSSSVIDRAWVVAWWQWSGAWLLSLWSGLISQPDSWSHATSVDQSAPCVASPPKLHVSRKPTLFICWNGHSLFTPSYQAWCVVMFSLCGALNAVQYGNMAGALLRWARKNWAGVQCCQLISINGSIPTWKDGALSDARTAPCEGWDGWLFYIITPHC